jgi:acetolactate synthase regulatory subunit
MKKLLVSIIASAFVLIFQTTLLIAGERGFSVGAVYNSVTFDAEGSNIETVLDDDQSRTSVSNDENYGSLFVEYNATADSGLGVSLGFEVVPGSVKFASKTRTDVNATDDDDSDAGTYIGEAEIANPKTIYIEPTYMFTDNLGMYIKGGISHVSFKETSNKGTGRTSTYGEKDVFGGMYGIGAKYKHPSGFFVKAEGALTKWSTFTTNNSTKTSTITVNPEQKNIRLAVGLAF